MTAGKTGFPRWKTGRREGFTLIEVLSVLAIISTLAAVTIPAVTKNVMDVRKTSYIVEAYLVKTAAQAYIIEASQDGLVSDMDLYEAILYPHVDDKENAMYDMLKGSCTKGGRLTGVTFMEGSFRVTGIIYQAGGYEVEILRESEIFVRKLEKKFKPFSTGFSTGRKNSRTIKNPGILMYIC